MSKITPAGWDGFDSEMPTEAHPFQLYLPRGSSRHGVRRRGENTLHRPPALGADDVQGAEVTAEPGPHLLPFFSKRALIFC